MTTEEYGDYGYGRGTQKASSSSYQREFSTPYYPKGTNTTRNQYNSSSHCSNSEQRKSSTYAHNKDTPSAVKPLKDEWEEYSDPEGSSTRKQEDRTTPPNNNIKNKRARYNDESSNDESTHDVKGDTCRESKATGRSDYNHGERIYNQPRSDYADSRDCGDRGRGRYDHPSRESRSSCSDDKTEDIYASVFCKKKLWVGGLPSNITCEEIRKYFEVYGKLIYVMISPKGNAFVKFSSESQALFAYKKCYTAYMREKLIKVKYAIRKANKIPHNKLLYINNVPSSFTRADLKKEFGKYGEIQDVQMFTCPYLYFFVTFELEDCAVKARKALKTKYFIQYGKNRVDEDKIIEGSPTEASPKGRPVDISECRVNDVLEPLSEDQTLELSDLLNSLQPTNAAIRVRRDWILDHIENANDVLLHVSVMLVAKDNSFTVRLSTLFLLHDLLSYCTQRRMCTEILDTISALTLPHLQRVIHKFRADSEEEIKSVLNILTLWGKYNVFPVAVVDELIRKFKAGERGSPEIW